MKIFIFYLIAIYFQCAHAATDDNGTIVLSDDWSYCYEYTWMGPDYNNYTLYNGTCSEYLNEYRAKNVPCSPPLVITYDGTPPNQTWLWENKRNSILCIQSQNKVCARYTYKYNGQIQNVTYMCTKAQQVGVGAITSGCYTQTFDGLEMEACICKSDKGLRTRPCNGAQKFEIKIFMVVLSIIGIFINT